jgi:CRP-like cAMP-binding protein
MRNPLTMKLEQITPFSADERRRLDGLLTAGQTTHPARSDIISEGDKVNEIHIVVTGLAARYKLLADGRRQIMAFLIPGDLCDAEVFVLSRIDHSICALSDTRCAVVPAAKVKELLTESSALTRALWWSTMTDSAVLRQRIIDHGRRGAYERLAHLFYEMLVRYRLIGEAPDDRFHFPVTQEEIGDATGLTPVHVNRTLKLLRDDGLVAFKSKTLHVLDAPRLKAAAGFDADYLHLDRTVGCEGPVAERAGDLV